MTARRSVLIQLLALAFAIGMALLALPFLSRGSETLLFAPLSIAGLIGGTVATIRGRHSPAVGIFTAMALSASFFAAEQGFLMGAAIFKVALGFRILLALVFGVFIGLAPVMSRIEQNPWCGVRTKWTLGSRRVWRETHRATGRLWFYGGAIGAGLTLLGAPLLTVGLLIALLSVYPIWISYAIWKRLGRP